MALQWRAPNPCPTQETVRDTVLRWLAQASQPKVTNGIAVRATVQRDARGFVLDLQLVTPGGRADEQLIAARCQTLADVVALKVALAADPLVVLETTSPPTAALGWGARLSLGVGPGALPGLGTTLTATGIMRLSGFSLELSAAYGLQQRVSYPDRPTIGGTLDMLSAIARACALPELKSVEFSLCTGPELGVLRAAGFGVATVFETTDLYMAWVLGPGVRWRVGGGFFAYFGVDAQLALLRPTFHIRNLTPLYQPERLAARLNAGVELHF